MCPRNVAVLGAELVGEGGHERVRYGNSGHELQRAPALGDPTNEMPAGGCVAEVVRQEQPDVLSLLEVSRDNLDALENELGMECVHSPYHEASATDVGGLAVCALGDTWQLAGGKPTRYLDNNDWFYVFSEVQAAGKVVNILAVHLYPYAVPARALREGGNWLDVGRSSEETVRAQGAQSAALLERVERFRDPSVLAGDFNSTRDFALHRALRQHLTDTWEHGGFGFGSTVDLLGWLPLESITFMLRRRLRSSNHGCQK